MNIYILLDQSGSMSHHWEETLGSINGYIAALEVKANIFLAAFDSVAYTVLRNTNSIDWKPLTKEEASPRGGTPLYDASARMMHRVLDDNPDKAIFLVMTDGFENESHNFKQADIKSIVFKLDAKKYETIFLGANFDKVTEVAATYNRGIDKTANMLDGNMGVFMAQSMKDATTRYASSTSASLNFTDQERSVGVKK